MKTLLMLLALAIAVPLDRVCASELFVTADVAAEMFSDRSLRAAAAAVLAEESVPVRPQTVTDRQYRMAYVWLTAATIYDVESTFYLLGRCDECRETNPISRPFVDRGRVATYAYSLAVNAAVMYVARRMLSRGDQWWRLAPVALTAVHLAAGTSNVYQSTSPPD